MKRFAFALSLLAAGLVCAQTPQAATATPGSGPHPHMRGPHGGNPDDRFEAHLTKALSLNATQQNTVHTVLEERRVSTKGLGQQMQALHTQMVTAIKNGDESSIEKVTTEMGTLHQQEQTAHAKAVSKIYASLTAEQKTKVGAHLEMLMHEGPGFEGFGRHGGPPPASTSSTASNAVKQ
jgi:Spy/CpxP family protein refolding chaperone